jgi:hypothetical protein
MRPIASLPIALLLLVPVTGSGPVLAAECASQQIEARGEPSRFLWLAKTKTRANWRRKVRTTPGLGTTYANWARAENTEERCMSGPSGHLCIFTGTPCKG